MTTRDKGGRVARCPFYILTYGICRVGMYRASCSPIQYSDGHVQVMC